MTQIFILFNGIVGVVERKRRTGRKKIETSGSGPLPMTRRSTEGWRPTFQIKEALVEKEER